MYKGTWSSRFNYTILNEFVIGLLCSLLMELEHVRAFDVTTRATDVRFSAGVL